MKNVIYLVHFLSHEKVDQSFCLSIYLWIAVSICHVLRTSKQNKTAWYLKPGLCYFKCMIEMWIRTADLRRGKNMNSGLCLVIRKDKKNLQGEGYSSLITQPQPGVGKTQLWELPSTCQARGRLQRLVWADLRSHDNVGAAQEVCYIKHKLSNFAIFFITLFHSGKFCVYN